MRYRFKAINDANNTHMFDRAYKDHEAAMQAAFAYVDLFMDSEIQSEQAKEKLVHSVIQSHNTHLLSFTHDNTRFVIEPDRTEISGKASKGSGH